MVVFIYWIVIVILWILCWCNNLILYFKIGFFNNGNIGFGVLYVNGLRCFFFFLVKIIFFIYFSFYLYNV